jgi:hypothetical protein
MVLALSTVAALSVGGAAPSAAAAGVAPRFSALSQQAIKTAGYEDRANLLIAAIRDSSFGPTSVVLHGQRATTPAAQGSRADDVQADKASRDVDHRPERTEDPRARTDKIGQTVAMSAMGKSAVTDLIRKDRLIEQAATEGHPDVDIVASRVESTGSTATVDRVTNRVLVQITSRVTEDYRSGVVSEGDETTNVVFDGTTGEVIAIRSVTDEDIAKTELDLFDPAAGDESPSSESGVTADPTRPDGNGVLPDPGPGIAHSGRYGAPQVSLLPMGMTATNKQLVVNYANTYWSNYNTSYRAFSVDCTNFVSQAMKAGGWADNNGPYFDDHYWWYNGLNQTYSWAAAENWYKYARVYSGRVTALTNVYSLRPGDVLQVKYGSDPTIHHSTIVTAYTGGEVYLTYHTTNRHNVSFSWFDAQQLGETYYAQRV